VTTDFRKWCGRAGSSYQKTRQTGGPCGTSWIGGSLLCGPRDKRPPCAPKWCESAVRQTAALHASQPGLGTPNERCHENLAGVLDRFLRPAGCPGLFHMVTLGRGPVRAAIENDCGPRAFFLVEPPRGSGSQGT